MNWLRYVLLAVCILSALAGYRKGLVRTVLSMVSLILVTGLAVRVSVREAAAKTMSSTGSAAAPEEAAAEDAAALEAELPQAVRAAAVVRPAAHRKFRREILFRFMAYSPVL